MPKVYNKYHGDAPSGSVYVGRPSKWGNSHPIGYCRRCVETHNREQAVAAFRRDCDESDRQAIKKQLRGRDLICYCAPLACHADVLLEIANE